MYAREPKEIQRLLRYGTPSDRLISLAEAKQAYVRIDGKKKQIHFPVSLNKAAGQKLIYSIAKKIHNFHNDLPVHSYLLLQDVKTNVKHRRRDTQMNIHMVAEAVLHRMASEFKPEVLFAFDSINVWISAVYGKELGYLTIRKALEILQAEGYFDIIEWGQRGARSRCTKIKAIFPGRKDLSPSAASDDWLLFNDHAMSSVYRRESTTRQDVLEAKIHHFADEMAEQILHEVSLWDQGYRLFKAADDRMSVANEASKDDAVTFEEVINDNYFDRLLGGLVPSLQENGTNYRQGDRGT